MFFIEIIILYKAVKMNFFRSWTSNALDFLEQLLNNKKLNLLDVE